MTRAQATERVEKLRTITVQRGATVYEQQAARACAATIVGRYGLERPAAPVAGASQDRRSWAEAHAHDRRAPGAAGPRAHDRRAPIAGAYARSTRTDRRAAGSRRFVAFA